MASEANREFFVSALAVPLAERFRALPDLDARIASWLERASSACEGFVPPPEVLLPYIAARVTAETDSLHVDDLALACACGAGDRKALAAFEARFFGELAASVSRLDAPAAVVDDATQQLRQRLLVAEGTAPPCIASYRGRSSLRTWLRVAMTREVLKLLERARPYVSLDDERMTVLPFVANNPELRVIQAQVTEQFEIAFQAALASLAPRDRNLLRQRYLDGLSIDELGARHQMHRATAARWLNKAIETVLEHTRRSLMEQLALSPSQCDSFLRGVQSQLDVSIRQHLLG